MRFEDIHGKDQVYTITSRKGKKRKTFAISGYGISEKKQSERFKKLLDFFKIPYEASIESF